MSSNQLANACAFDLCADLLQCVFQLLQGKVIEVRI